MGVSSRRSSGLHRTVQLLQHYRSGHRLGLQNKFGLGVQNEAGQRLMKFYQENALVVANTLFQQHKTLHMDITDGQY